MQAADHLDRQLLGALPQHRGQLGQHHGQVLLLADEGVGARLQHLHLGGVVVGGGHQDARGVPQRRVQADPADHRGAVDAGHHPVHDHRVWPPVRRHPQPLLAAGGGQHRVALRFEQVAQLFPEGQAVVDDQDGGPVARLVGRFAQQLAGTRHHVPGVVRLAHVLVGADPQPGQPVGDLALAGQQHGHHVRAAGGAAQLGEQLQTVRVGQQHVQHRGVEPGAGERGTGLGPGGAEDGGEPVVGERLVQVHPHGQVVVDDQHGRGHRRAPAGCRSARRAAIRAGGSTCWAAPSRAASRGMP